MAPVAVAVPTSWPDTIAFAIEVGAELHDVELHLVVVRLSVPAAICGSLPAQRAWDLAREWVPVLWPDLAPGVSGWPLRAISLAPPAALAAASDVIWVGGYPGGRILEFPSKAPRD